MQRNHESESKLTVNIYTRHRKSTNRSEEFDSRWLRPPNPFASHLYTTIPTHHYTYTTFVSWPVRSRYTPLCAITSGACSLGMPLYANINISLLQYTCDLYRSTKQLLPIRCRCFIITTCAQRPALQPRRAYLPPHRAWHESRPCDRCKAGTVIWPYTDP